MASTTYTFHPTFASLWPFFAKAHSSDPIDSASYTFCYYLKNLNT